MAILGRNTPSGFGNLLNPDSIMVYRVTLATPLELQELWASVRCQAGTVNMRCVFFDDDGAGGEPKTLLAVGADISVPITGSRQTRGGPVVTPVSLPAGNYWLGVHAGGNAALELDDDGSGLARKSSADAFTGGAANPWVGTASSFSGSLMAWGVVSVPANYVRFDAAVGAPTAGQYLCGTFICGLGDQAVVTAGLSAAPQVFVQFATGVQGQAAVAGQESLTHPFAATVQGGSALSAGLGPIRSFAVPVAGASAVGASLNVFKLVSFAASVNGQATVATPTLGKVIDLAVHLGNPYLCGEHLCGTFVCDQGCHAEVYTTFLAVTRSLGTVVVGQANVLALVGFTRYLAVQVSGQATVTASRLVIILLWDSGCLDLALDPTVCRDDDLLVPAGDFALALDPSECR